MFQALKKQSDRIALDKGASVQLGMAEMLRIQEGEGLPAHIDDRNLNYIVRTYLSDWCANNIKGRWELMRDIDIQTDKASEDVLIFTFANKREAVRFKLTWGGK